MICGGDRSKKYGLAKSRVGRYMGLTSEVVSYCVMSRVVKQSKTIDRKSDKP